MKHLVLLVMSVPASVCFGQQGGMAAADTNKDGGISTAELRAYVSSRLPDFEGHNALFKALDKNGDGSINETEFAGRMKAIRQAIQQLQVPAEKQKKPEPIEFVDRYEKMFAGRDPGLGATIDAGLSAFDADGNPFSFERTRGKHTVIVFGCLT